MSKLVKVLAFEQEGSLQRFQVAIPARFNHGKRWFRRFVYRKDAQKFADRFNLDPQGAIAELHEIELGAQPKPLGHIEQREAERLFEYLQQKELSLSDGFRAIDFYFEANYAASTITVAKAVEEYHAYRKMAGVKARVLSDDEYVLKKLVIAFGPSRLSSITTEELRKFFYDIPTGEDGTASHRISLRMKIGPFFTWASGEDKKGRKIQDKYLRRNPISPISKDSLGIMGVNKDYYTPEVFLRMLQVAKEEFRDTLYPWFVASGFLGLRTEEIIRSKETDDRVRWSDCLFDTKKQTNNAHIHIRRTVGKGRKEGKIEAPFAIEAFQAWLPKPEEDGFICPAQEHQIQAAKARFTKQTGIELYDNGLRNSFATYTRAHLQSAVLAAEQLRNHVAVASKHYITILPKALGEQYFNLRPEPEPQNIVEFRTGTED